MEMKEKLVELLHKGVRCPGTVGSCMDCPHYSLQNPCDEYAATADMLIANGVTVQEGKPLEAFLHPIDAYKGLKAKYLVFKADTGEKVDNCFVLRPDKDPAAVEALRAYASATDNETLAEDIYNWVGKGGPVQEWISVKDRLPSKEEYTAKAEDGTEYYVRLLIAYKTDIVEYEIGYYDGYKWMTEMPIRLIKDVVAWMPFPNMPQPPKGE